MMRCKSAALSFGFAPQELTDLHRRRRKGEYLYGSYSYGVGVSALACTVSACDNDLVTGLQSELFFGDLLRGIEEHLDRGIDVYHYGSDAPGEGKLIFGLLVYCKSDDVNG